MKELSLFTGAGDGIQAADKNILTNIVFLAR